MVSLLSTKFHEILFSSFRGVALTNCVKDRTDGQTDRRTGQKQYCGGRHNISYLTSQLPVVTKGSIILSSNPSPFFNKLNRWNLKKKCFFQELQQLIIACKFTVIYNSFFSRFHLLLNCGGGYDRKGGWWQGMKI